MNAEICINDWSEPDAVKQDPNPRLGEDRRSTTWCELFCAEKRPSLDLSFRHQEEPITELSSSEKRQLDAEGCLSNLEDIGIHCGVHVITSSSSILTTRDGRGRTTSSEKSRSLISHKQPRKSDQTPRPGVERLEAHFRQQMSIWLRLERQGSNVMTRGLLYSTSTVKSSAVCTCRLVSHEGIHSPSISRLA